MGERVFTREDAKGLIRTNTEKLTLPFDFTEIASGALAGFSQVKALVIPEGITRIGSYAFYTRSFKNTCQIEILTIPSSLKQFDRWCFYDCNSLKSITLPSDFDETLAVELFSHCPDATLFFGKTFSIGKRVVPFAKSKTVQQIMDERSGLLTLGGASMLRIENDGTLIIPANYHTILPNAMKSIATRGVKKVVIPNTIQKIAPYTFSLLQTLEEIEVSTGIEHIDPCAFANCRQLKKITLPNTLREVGAGAFMNLPKLEKIQLPPELTAISDEMLSNCTSLTRVKFGKSITRIGAGAFSDCSAVRSLKLPESIKSIGNSAFWNCRSLQRLYVPSGCEKVSQSTFGNCPALETLFIPRIIHDQIETKRVFGDMTNPTITWMEPGMPRPDWHYDDDLPDIEFDEDNESEAKQEAPAPAEPEQLPSDVRIQSAFTTEERKDIVDAEAVRQIERSIASMQSQLKNLTAAAGAVESAPQLDSDMLNQLQRNLSQMQQNYDAVQSLQHSAETLDHLQKQIDQFTEMQSKMQQISAVQESVEEKVRNLSDLEDKVEQIGDVSQIAAELSEVKESVGSISEMKEAVSSIQDIRDKVDELTDLKASVETVGDFKEMAGAISDIQEKVSAIDEVQEKIDAINEAGATVEAISDVQEKISAIPELQQKVDDLSEQTNVANELRDIAGAISQVQEKLNVLPEIQQRVDLLSSGTGVHADGIPPTETQMSLNRNAAVAMAGTQNAAMIETDTQSNTVVQPEHIQENDALEMKQNQNKEQIPMQITTEHPQNQYGNVIPFAPIHYGEYSNTDKVFTHEISKSLPGPVERSNALKSYTIIARRAFCGSEGGERFEIPEGIRRIESQAFWDCPRLMALEIPASLTEIEPDAFAGCTRLTDVYLPVDYPDRKAVDLFLFRPEIRLHWPKKKILSRPRIETVADLMEQFDDILTMQKVKKLTVRNHFLEIPEGYTAIAPFCMKEIDIRADEPEHILTTIILPKSVLRVSSYAFAGLEAARHIVIPEGLRIVEMNAFTGCTGPFRLILPNSVSYIGPYAFAAPCQYEQIRLPKTLRTINENTFSNCNTLVSLSIPNAVQSIGVCALSGCTNLNTLTISERFANQLPAILDGPVKIMINWLEDHTNLYKQKPSDAIMNVVAPHFQPVSGQRMFTLELSRACSDFNERLKEMRMHPVIAPLALSEMSNQTKFEIPLGVIRLCSYAFGYNQRLMTLTVPKALTEFDYAAFYDCERLRDIFLPEEFDRDAAAVLFMRDPSILMYFGNARPIRIRQLTVECPWILTSSDVVELDTVDDTITVPNGYLVIASFMYHGILGKHTMKRFVLASSVRLIGSSSFVHLRQLEEIVCPEGLLAVEPAAFVECPNLKRVVLPNTLRFLGVRAFVGCENLQEIVIPSRFADRMAEIVRECPKVKLTFFDAPVDEAVTEITEVVDEIPAVEPVLDEIPEIAEETVAEEATEPVDEIPAVEPVLDEITEIAEETVAEEAAEPIDEIPAVEPVLDEIPEIAEETVADEATEIVDEIPAVEPVLDEIPEIAEETVAEEATEPVDEIPAVEPVLDEIPEIAEETVADEATEIVDEIPAVEPVLDEITEIAEETVADEATEIVDEIPAVEPVFDEIPEIAEKTVADEATEIVDEIPAVEPVLDEITEIAEETVAEEATEIVDDIPAVEPVLDEITEIAEETVAEEAAEPVDEIPAVEPVLDEIPEIAEETAAEEAAEPVDEIPAVEPVFDEIPEIAEKTVADEATEIVDEIPAVEPVLDEIPEIAEETVADEATEIVDEIPAVEPVLDEIPEIAEETVADEATEIVDEIPAVEPVLDEIPEIADPPAELISIADALFAEPHAESFVAQRTAESADSASVELEAPQQNELPTLEGMEPLGEDSLPVLSAFDDDFTSAPKVSAWRRHNFDAAALSALGVLSEPDDIAFASQSAAPAAAAPEEKADIVIPKDGRFSAKERNKCYHGEAVLEIPAGYLEIRAGACAGLENMESAVLPNTIVKIGSGAFSDSTLLKNIYIPLSVKEIASDAFEGCDSLETVTMPRELEWLASELFGENVEITWLEEQKQETAAIDVGDGRFTRQVRRALYHGEPTLIIPEGYTEIRPGACAGLETITEVRLPNTLQKICSGAFSECTSLRVLAIPASVTILEEDAFEDCDMLSMVAVPSHLAKDAKLCFPDVDLAILD